MSSARDERVGDGRDWPLSRHRPVAFRHRMGALVNMMTFAAATTPASDGLTLLVNGLFCVMTLASLVLWTKLWRGGLPLLSAVGRGEPQTIARWSLFDLVVVLVAIFFPQMLVQGLALRAVPVTPPSQFDSEPPPAASVPAPLSDSRPIGDSRSTSDSRPTGDSRPTSDSRPPGDSRSAAASARDRSPELLLAEQNPAAFVSLLWLRSAALLVGTGIGIAWVWSRHRDRLALGGDWCRWRTDLRLGAIGFLMLAPPVLLIQLALTQFFPSQHPLIELVLAKPEARFLAACGFTAVVVAPLAEEFQFRVLIQGWLQTAARPGIPSESWLVGLPSPELEPRLAEQRLAEPPRHWPAIATAALFALAHATHGPDPIPLFFFAWGIGWLYRGTSRVLPGIVVHFLLNLWTLFLLLVRIYGNSLT
jgi:membrane protease YdiL (CAAX protease family)